MTRGGLLGLLLALAPATAPPHTGADVLPAAAVDELASPDGRYPQWIDPSVDAGVDFFLFANGGWLKSHPIPGDRSYWGVDTLLEQKNQTLIRDMLESLVSGGVQALVGESRQLADFYVSGMDEHGIEAAGVAPLHAELGRISAIATREDLQAEFAHLQLIGVAAPLQLAAMQDFFDSSRVIAVATQAGLGLPDRDYYLRNEAVFAAARREYELHVMRMLLLLGEAPSAARGGASAVMTLETRLARASMSDVEQRDPRAIYHPMGLRQAAVLTPHFDWSALLRGVGHPEITSLNVAMPRFFESIDRLLRAVPLEDWRSYLRWQLVAAYAPYLSAPFVEEDFRMRSVLTGAKVQQDRWLRVLEAEGEALGFAIGRRYVQRNFPPSAKLAAASMVERIRGALREELRSLAWMSASTRAAALDKLDQMEMRIGYPDRWRDYSALRIDRGPYAGNMLRAREFEQRRQYDKIGRPVDRSEWSMTPQTVNAYYDPSRNTLNIPAGILQQPFFDARWPDAVDYGATGATVVGHEMTHGFDDEGAKFDGRGNLRDWWVPGDLQKFQAATRCISRQFSRYAVAGGLHLQGDLVTGEAAADLGGLKLAWIALHSLPAPAGAADSIDRDFFLAFAHAWAGVTRPEEAREMSVSDPHPPAQFRTDGTLSNSAEFQAAFSVRAPGAMVNNPRCVIW